MDADIDALELTILRPLRDATAKAILRWERSSTDEDHYFTISGPVSSTIQFRWVSFNGDQGSDRDFVEVGGSGHHGWNSGLVARNGNSGSGQHRVLARTQSRDS